MITMPKIPKVVAGYLPAKFVSPAGTSCGTCRDFIRSTSECVVLTNPKVSAQRGTCILYVLGQPHEYIEPLRLLPNDIAGYTEGPEVPTYCGRCAYYERPDRYRSPCSKVGDTDDDRVEFGGCCNGYQPRDEKGAPSAPKGS